MAREAGDLLRDRFGGKLGVSHKGRIDLVTEADLQSEALIRERLAIRYPRHQLLAEEGGLADGSSSDHRWIVDPLDGTTNFAHGYPVFCVSIALEVGGKVELGVVYDPMRDELFAAERGAGASLNNKPIRVSSTEKLSGSLLSTGFPYDIKTSRLTNLEHWSNFALRVQGLRRDGAAALDLCYVGCGRHDGFWELGLSPWDVAAGTLIVEEAGGRVTDLHGGPSSIYRREILASNQFIHDQMVEVLALDQSLAER
ncbi:MAG: inositol monophosphatase [Acidobacteria bacterium]|nr:inositol monophosphatase [Acidobacteriota bacterium]